MNEDWKVQIPIRFKKNLNRRFRYGNAKMGNLNAIIDIECDLCKEYIIGTTCGKCPFTKFVKQGDYYRGCIIWIKKFDSYPFIMDDTKIWWPKHRNNSVKQFFTKLRREARKYIEWVEE